MPPDNEDAIAQRQTNHVGTQQSGCKCGLAQCWLIRQGKCAHEFGPNALRVLNPNLPSET